MKGLIPTKSPTFSWDLALMSWNQAWKKPSDAQHFLRCIPCVQIHPSSRLLNRENIVDHKPPNHVSPDMFITSWTWTFKPIWSDVITLLHVHLNPDYFQFNGHKLNVFCIVSFLFIPPLFLHLVCCRIARIITMVVHSNLLIISCSRRKYLSNACARYYLEFID